MNDNPNIRALTLRPDYRQYIIAQMPSILLALVMIVCFFMDFFGLRLCFLIVDLFIITLLICQAFYLMRVRYTISQEQIIYMHGILYHETDFMELYRVVDYQEKRSFMQQMLGLKDVVIFSMDRNLPRLTMTGMKEELNLIEVIRQRVEFNKHQKGIYEITNR